MKIKRLKPLDWVIVAIVVIGLAGPVGVLVWEWSQQEGPNYTYIADRLYMGGQTESPPPGTSAVLNLCLFEDSYKSNIEVYCWQPIRDSSPAPDLKWLREQVNFVDAQQRAGRTTFVHCQAGVSRAGMVVTAYFMFKNKWTRDKALAFVRSRRPVVRPNGAFMERLLEWERSLKQ